MSRLHAAALLGLAVTLLASAPGAQAGGQTAAAAYPLNPSVNETAIYVSSGGVTRFDRRTLQKSWRALAGVNTFEPVLTPGAILVGSTQGLYALAPASGDVLWRLAPEHTLFSPAAMAGTAYVGAEDGSLRAVAVDTGEILWTRRFEGWIYPPAVVDGVVVAGGSGAVLHGVDAVSGHTRWTRPLSQELVYRPVSAGHSGIIVTTFAPDIARVAAADGRVIWRRRDMTPAFPPTVAGDRLLTGSFGGTLKARRIVDGRLLWQRRLGRKLSFPPRVSADAVLVGDEQGRVASFELETGNLLWQRRERVELIASPMASSTGALVFSSDGGLASWPATVSPALEEAERNLLLRRSIR